MQQVQIPPALERVATRALAVHAGEGAREGHALPGCQDMDP